MMTSFCKMMDLQKSIGLLYFLLLDFVILIYRMNEFRRLAWLRNKSLSTTLFPNDSTISVNEAMKLTSIMHQSLSVKTF